LGAQEVSSSYFIYISSLREYWSIQYIIGNKNSFRVSNKSKSQFDMDFSERIVSKTSKFEKSSNKVSYYYQ